MASAPPTAERPAVTVMADEPADTVPVATLANVFTPEKYGIFPITAAVEVERPLKLSVPEVVMVPPVMGQVVAIEVTEPLPHGFPVVIRSPPVLACTQLPLERFDDERAVVEAYGNVDAFVDDVAVNMLPKTVSSMKMGLIRPTAGLSHETVAAAATLGIIYKPRRTKPTSIEASISSFFVMVKSYSTSG